MINSEFAQRLQKLLEEKGIKNNNRFAQAINKNPIVTLGWLKGKMPRLLEDWIALCDFFNVSADFLFLGRERKEEPQECKITVRIPITDPDKGALSLDRFLESQKSPQEEMVWYLLLLLLKNKFSSQENHVTCEISASYDESKKST